jgi:molybdate transport system ATP-binding protein
LSGSLLTVTMRHRVGAVALDVNFRLTQPWTVLFGPSGSGKTTVLRAIAGFVRPDGGRIESASVPWFDAAAKIFVSPHKRAVRSAGQMARLFPHMTVRRNVSYGSGWASKPDEVRGIVDDVMASFGLRDLADRMPQDLSGGERQRASVARALVSAMTFDRAERPLLLLDEPLAGLDVAARDRLVAELKQWTERCKIPVLSVTHALGEAFQLAADVVKIADGQVVQHGPVREVLTEERLQLLRQLGGQASPS